MRQSSGSSTALRRAGIALGLVLAYVLLGNFLHQIVFAQPPPDPDTFPRVGDLLRSDTGDYVQRIVAIEDGWVHSELVVAPNAAGPPLHYHQHFDEQFEVAEGVIDVVIGDATYRLGAGDAMRVPAQTPHTFANPGPGSAVIAGEAPAIPLTFAACLVQLYSISSELGSPDSPMMLLHMSAIDPICDTHPAAVPRPLLHLAKLLLAPAARLAGLRNYYPERSLHPPS